MSGPDMFPKLLHALVTLAAPMALQVWGDFLARLVSIAR